MSRLRNFAILTLYLLYVPQLYGGSIQNASTLNMLLLTYTSDIFYTLFIVFWYTFLFFFY